MNITCLCLPINGIISWHIKITTKSYCNAPSSTNWRHEIWHPRPLFGPSAWCSALLPIHPCSLWQPKIKHDKRTRLLLASRSTAQIPARSGSVSHSPTHQSTDAGLLLQAFLQIPINGHDVAAGSLRVVKLAHLCVLCTLQYLQDFHADRPTYWPICRICDKDQPCTQRVHNSAGSPGCRQTHR